MTKHRSSRAIRCKEADKQAEVKVLLSVSLLIWFVFLTLCYYFFPHDLTSSELNQHKSMCWLPDVSDGMWTSLISCNLNLNTHSVLKWLQNESQQPSRMNLRQLWSYWMLLGRFACCKTVHNINFVVCWVESELQQPSMNIHGDNAYWYFIKVGSIRSIYSCRLIEEQKKTLLITTCKRISFLFLYYKHCIFTSISISSVPVTADKHFTFRLFEPDPK